MHASDQMVGGQEGGNLFDPASGAGLEWLLKRARIPPVLSHRSPSNLPSPYIIDSHIFYVLCCRSRREPYIEVKDGLELTYVVLRP
jgi:hypothetical protein